MLFERVNGAGEHVWLRIPQQWGTPWTLPIVGVLAATQRNWRVAMTAVACLPAEKLVESVTKHWRKRSRPVYVQPTVLRDDAPVEGGSMPSGHAAIATCGAVLVSSLLSAPAQAVVIVVAALSAGSRIHQGAHEPADAVAGMSLGAGLALLLGDLMSQLGKGS